MKICPDLLLSKSFAAETTAAMHAVKSHRKLPYDVTSVRGRFDNRQISREASGSNEQAFPLSPQF